MAKPSDEDTVSSTDMPFEEGKTEDENPYGTEDDSIDDDDDDDYYYNGIDDDDDDEIAASADGAKEGGGDGGGSRSFGNEGKEENDSMELDANEDPKKLDQSSTKNADGPGVFSKPLERKQKTKKIQSSNKPRKVDGSPPRKKRPSVVQDVEEAPIGEETKKKRKKKPNPIYAATEQSEKNVGNIYPTSTPPPPKKRGSPSKSPPPILYPLYPLKFEARIGTNYQSRKNVHDYALKMVCLVCEQNDVAVVNRNSLVGSTIYNKLPYECLDVPPPSLGYTVETEPEKLKRMRLNLRARFASAMDNGISVVEFADRLLRFWGGSLVGIQSAKELEGMKRAEAEAIANLQAAKKAAVAAVSSQPTDNEQITVDQEGTGVPQLETEEADEEMII